MHHANWIDGSWQPALAGDQFTTELDGRWPRSGGGDVAAALEAARGAAGAWSRTTLDQRVEVLEDALDHWEEDDSAEQRLAALLGLAEGALDPVRDEAIDLADTLLEEAEEPAAAEVVAPVLVRVPAAELTPGLVRAVFRPLLAGRALLLLSDADLPRLATSFCDRLDSVGLPPGVISLLHDDRSGTLRSAIQSGGFSRIRYGGTGAQNAAVKRWLSTGAAAAPRGGGPAPFGVGVVEVAPPELHLYTPRNSGFVVREEDDPERAAQRICRGAFGAAETLSGQRAGQIGRVICHERVFSSFTEALLETHDELGEDRCALVDRSLREYVDGLGRVGLDEGATMIRGGFGGAATKRARSRAGTPAPVVFTNVEAQMELALASRPAPVLCLLRAADDDEGEELDRALGG